MTGTQNCSSLSDLGGHLLQPPAQSRINAEIRPVCSGFVQSGFENLQTWRFPWLLWGSVQVLSYRHREKILPLVRSLPCCSLTALLFPSYAPQWRASLSLSNLLSGTGKLVLAPPGALASRLNKPNFLSFCILLYTSVGGLWEVWSTGQNRPCKHDCGKAHLESPQESLLCQDLYSCSPCQKQSSKMLYFNYSYISFLKFFGVLGLVFFNNVRW